MSRGLVLSKGSLELGVSPDFADGVIDADGRCVLDASAASIWRVTPDRDFVLSVENWPQHGSLELIADRWGAYAADLPTHWRVGAAGLPDPFPSDDYVRLVARTDDAGATVDLMCAWEPA